MAAILKMAAMSAKGPIRGGSISKSVHNMLVYLCAKFGAFMTKCTIGLLSCPAITSIRMDDVIMQFQDSRQKHLQITMFISQEETFRSTSFQRRLYYIDYNLSFGSHYKEKNWWRHHAIPRWSPKNIYSAHISETNAPIDVISTPFVLYRLQPIIWIT